MKRSAWWSALGYLAGLTLGCSTAAVVAQDDTVKRIPPAKPAPIPQVVGPAAAQKRYLPNGKATASLYVTGDNAFVGRLEMAPGAKVPQHRDPTEEYIYVIEGSGTITIDGERSEVGPNTAIYMPAGAEVSFQNGAAPFVALQVFAKPGPEAKYLKWSDKAPAAP